VAGSTGGLILHKEFAMPRRARHYQGGSPYHIYQRGNNKQVVFRDQGDFNYYILLWQRMSEIYGLDVHSFCLMTNHVHFLVTPRKADGISRTMKVVGSCFARFMNVKYERTGTLWEGRHGASLVQSSLYFLTCHHYIEQNPVRAKMVLRPQDYKWSSFGENAFGHEGWMKPHPQYLALGKTDKERQAAYRKLLAGQLDPEKLSLIRQAMSYQQPLADEDFKQELKLMGLEIGQTRRGRPARQSSPAHPAL
jgi:putative transposase